MASSSQFKVRHITATYLNHYIKCVCYTAQIDQWWNGFFPVRANGNGFVARLADITVIKQTAPKTLIYKAVI